ncbi:MAG: hypothetical protein LBK82_12160 [Planctomycetaceae bacterium]|nr:hypothetical protein [Planctomycetaceae bacterium]
MGDPLAERSRRLSRYRLQNGRQHKLLPLIWFTVGEYADATVQRTVAHLPRNSRDTQWNFHCM